PAAGRHPRRGRWKCCSTAERRYSHGTSSSQQEQQRAATRSHRITAVLSSSNSYSGDPRSRRLRRIDGIAPVSSIFNTRGLLLSDVLPEGHVGRSSLSSSVRSSQGIASSAPMRHHSFVT